MNELFPHRDRVLFWFKSSCHAVDDLEKCQVIYSRNWGFVFFLERPPSQQCRCLQDLRQFNSSGCFDGTGFVTSSPPVEWISIFLRSLPKRLRLFLPRLRVPPSNSLPSISPPSHYRICVDARMTWWMSYVSVSLICAARWDFFFWWESVYSITVKILGLSKYPLQPAASSRSTTRTFPYTYCNLYLDRL